MYFDFFAASMLQRRRGLPRKGRTFFLGVRLEPRELGHVAASGSLLSVSLSLTPLLFEAAHAAQPQHALHEVRHAAGTQHHAPPTPGLAL